MGKAIAKNLGGRPTLYSEEAVKKLESIFQVGGTVDEAVSYAGISKQTYYDWIDRHDGLLTKMEAAQHYADVVAKNVVVDNIVKNRDVGTAKWWLEKRQFKEASVQISGEKVLVIPSELLDKYGIQPDNPTRITETSSN